MSLPLNRYCLISGHVWKIIQDTRIPGFVWFYTRFRFYSRYDAACLFSDTSYIGDKRSILCPSGYIWQKAFSMYALGLWYRKNDTDGTGYFINFLPGIFSERFLLELCFRSIFSETRFSITTFLGSMYLKSAYLRNSCVLLKWGQRFIHMFRIWQKERI